MPNAPDAYKNLVNNFISPMLRSLGFKGSSGSYQLPNEKAYVLIGFQKNKWNTQENVEFTVNVSIIEKIVWEKSLIENPWMGKKPSSNMQYPIEMWPHRLGHMRTLGATDKWWKIKADTDLEKLAEDISNRTVKDALPRIHDQLNRL